MSHSRSAIGRNSIGRELISNSDSFTDASETERDDDANDDDLEQQCRQRRWHCRHNIKHQDDNDNANWLLIAIYYESTHCSTTNPK